jgi:hypothetical protein
MNAESTHSTRIAIFTAAVSFILSCIFAYFYLGQRTGKVVQLDTWQKEAAPRMERMDAQGTLSQQFFLKSYQEEQAKQYKRLDKLEEEASHMELMKAQIDELNRKVDDGLRRRISPTEPNNKSER